MSSQCQGRTIRGSLCTRRHHDSRPYCWQHVGLGKLITVDNHRPIQSIIMVHSNIDINTRSVAKPRIRLVVKRHNCEHVASPDRPPSNGIKYEVRVSREQSLSNSIKSGEVITREAYICMHAQDRLEIPMSSIVKMLKIHALAHNDYIVAQTPRDQMIASRRLRNRLDAFFHRPPGPYTDLSGNKYYNEKYSTSKIQPLYYSEFYYHPYSGSSRILGERDLDLERKSYDPLFPKACAKRLQAQICNSGKYTNDKDKVRESHKVDLVTLCELSELNDPDMIYIEVSGLAYYLHSIIGRWEASFSVYDKECGRVVPQYPSDFNNEPMPPQLVRNIQATYLDRRSRTGSTDLVEYPLIGILCGYGSLLEDLYGFIIGYKEIRQKYDSLTDLYPEDEGLANRRDLMAIQALKELYTRQKLEDFGYRKYASYTSTNGANGTQIFYQHVLCSVFHTAGYRPAIDTQDDEGLPVNLRWEYLPGQESAVIFGSSILHICRPGYHYLLAFK